MFPLVQLLFGLIQPGTKIGNFLAHFIGGHVRVVKAVQHMLFQLGLLGGKTIRLLGKALLIFAQPLGHQRHFSGEILHKLAHVLALQGRKHPVHKILGGLDDGFPVGGFGDQFIFFGFAHFYTRRIPSAACSDW